MNRKVFLNSTDKACFPNRLDLNKIRKFLEENNWQFVDDYCEADLILTGTCAYEKSFEDDSINRIIKIQDTKKPDAKFIVWGCLPKINKERLQEVFHGDFVGPDEFEKLNDLISAETNIQDIDDANELTEEDISTYAAYPKLFNFIKPLFNGIEKHLRLKLQPFYNYSACIFGSDTFYLRVSSGCLNRCSYCAIKNARGDLKSKPLNTVVDEFKLGLKQGYKEFALVGQEVGSYGVDIKTDLVELLNLMVKEDGDYKLHLLFIEPSWFVKLFPKLKEVLKSGKITSINLTVQSGSDRILRNMNRFYKIDDVMGCIRELKEQSPGVIVRTHLMVGFPDETEEDFQKTVGILNKFDLVNGLFEFSPRAGTPAAKLDNQIPADIKKKRYNKLYWKGVRKAFRSFKIESSSD
jgi:tRNA A37 methylthiotransferase MiaB